MQMTCSNSQMLTSAMIGFFSITLTTEADDGCSRPAQENIVKNCSFCLQEGYQWHMAVVHSHSLLRPSTDASRLHSTKRNKVKLPRTGRHSSAKDRFALNHSCFGELNSLNNRTCCWQSFEGRLHSPPQQYIFSYSTTASGKANLGWCPPVGSTKTPISSLTSFTLQPCAIMSSPMIEAAAHHLVRPPKHRQLHLWGNGDKDTLAHIKLFMILFAQHKHTKGTLLLHKEPAVCKSTFTQCKVK